MFRVGRIKSLLFGEDKCTIFFLRRTGADEIISLWNTSTETFSDHRVLRAAQIQMLTHALTTQTRVKLHLDGGIVTHIEMPPFQQEEDGE